MMGVLTKKDFYRIDEVVMGHAFDIQNGFGNLCSEIVYRKELARRCINDTSGLIDNVVTEAAFYVDHKNFRKAYYADIIINNVIPYELKTAESLNPKHVAQLLNYLNLMSQRYGKLINFKPHRVEYRFVSSAMDVAERHKYMINDQNWYPVGPDCWYLKDLILQMIEDIGLCLDTSLYSEIISFLLQKQRNVIQPIDIIDNGTLVAHQKAHLLNGEVAFKITTLTDGIAEHKMNLRKFLVHTELSAIQWVNLGHHDVTCITVMR